MCACSGTTASPLPSATTPLFTSCREKRPHISPHPLSNAPHGPTTSSASTTRSCSTSPSTSPTAKSKRPASPPCATDPSTHLSIITLQCISAYNITLLYETFIPHPSAPLCRNPRYRRPECRRHNQRQNPRRSCRRGAHRNPRRRRHRLPPLAARKENLIRLYQPPRQNDDTDHQRRHGHPKCHHHQQSANRLFHQRP